MAMMKCPGCGQDISDQAERCVHCGIDLKNRSFCPECGKAVTDGEDVCPNCGFPLNRAKKPDEDPVYYEPADDEDADSFPRNEPGKKKKKKRKGTWFIPFIVLVLLFVVPVMALLDDQEYTDNFNHVSEIYNSQLDNLNGTKELLIKTWSNAIFKQRDPKTDPYTRPNGVFVSDFNTALENLYSDPDFAEKIQSMHDAKIELIQLRKELEDAPSRYEDLEPVILRYIDAIVDAITLVESPNGSLKDISENIGDAITELNNVTEELNSELEAMEE